MKTLALALLLAAAPALAHEPAEKTVAERSADKQAIDAALAQVYATISGPVGQERDWEAARALFTPDARLTAIGANGLRGGTIDDYIKRSGPFLVARGFTEHALVNRIEIYGDLAHAWSSYAATWTEADGSTGAVRGINSVQLVRQAGDRWLVQSIFWQAESPDNPLPRDMELSQ